MASLIGIDWPANSVGVLPDVDPTRAGYLAPREGEETLAWYALINAQVLLEHYHMKHGEPGLGAGVLSPCSLFPRRNKSGTCALLQTVWPS